MNNRIIGTLILLTAVTAVQGCSREYDQKSLVPGVYEARSTPDKNGGYSIAKITVKNRRIAAVDYHTYTADGKLKDADYGKVNGEIVSQEDYKKAQHAVAAQQKYADQLLEVQNINFVDGITGASIIYDQFNETVRAALDQAERKYSLGDLKDGTYTGKSGDANSHHGDYATVKVTLKDHRITDVVFDAYTRDGSLKDENYGRNSGKKPKDMPEGTELTEDQKQAAETARRQHYEKAQQSIKAHPKYVEQLISTQDLSKVDAVTGATRSYDQFVEATSNALEQAGGKQ